MAIRTFIDRMYNPAGFNTYISYKDLGEQEITYKMAVYLNRILNRNAHFKLFVSRKTPKAIVGTDNISSIKSRLQNKKKVKESTGNFAYGICKKFLKYSNSNKIFNGKIPLKKKNVINQQEENKNDIYEEFLKENPVKGYIRTEVVTDPGETPVVEAKVIVSKTLNGQKYILSELITNSEGKTPAAQFPTKSAELSRMPGVPTPYAAYDISVEHANYISEERLNVPVFENIVSVQKVPLKAKPLSSQIRKH